VGYHSHKINKAEEPHERGIIMKKNFTQKAKDQVTLSFVMLNREKKSVDDMITDFPNGFIILEVDMARYTKDVREDGVLVTKNVEYPIISTKESPETFFCGGVILKNIVNDWSEGYNDDFMLLTRDLKEEGGVKIQMSHGKSKNGNQLVNIDILG
jgi:hypothetical protein